MIRMTTTSLAIACSLLVTPVLAWSEDGQPTRLETAVEALNARLAAYPFDAEGIRTRALSVDERPGPLTVHEVLSAIREWDREKHPIVDAHYQIYQEIIDTGSLPARAALRFNVQWRHSESDEDVESREFWINLVVMTGEKTGYGFRVRKQRLDERQYLPLAPGFSWVLPPRPARPSAGNSNGVLYLIENDAERALRVVASTLLGKEMHDLRGVAFDRDGTRYDLTRRGIGQHENMVMMTFDLDGNDVPPGQIEYFGIEGLRGGGLLALSQLAIRNAANQGIQVLPLPIVGRPLEFTLTASSGEIIDSKEMLGKVVVIDCWASWCGPCIRGFPKLKELHEQYHAEGLEILGLSVDESPDAAKEVYRTREIGWPLVTIPEEKAARELWEPGSTD